MSLNSQPNDGEGLFQKGMTLEDYIRLLEKREQKIPTVRVYSREDNHEECLQSTTHNAGNSPRKSKITCIKQIEEEEHFQESLDQHQKEINIGSTYLHKASKQHSIGVIDQKGLTRIRIGRSMSPYSQIPPLEYSTAQQAFKAKFAKLQPCPPKQFHLERMQPSPLLRSFKHQHKNCRKVLPEETATPKMHITGIKWWSIDKAGHEKGDAKSRIRLKQRIQTKNNRRKHTKEPFF